MVSSHSWCYPTGTLTLPNEEVHVWRAGLDLHPTGRDNLWAVLSPDEQARRMRYRFPQDREHFIAARAILRLILARYLDQDPAQLQFYYGLSGKPCLASGSGPGGIQFNLSHSGGLALYAVTRNRHLGIDLERLRPDFPYEQIAERFFSPLEVSSLGALAPELRCEAFFNYWTLKEAFIKATGEGLSFPLDRFAVSLVPDAPAGQLNIKDDPQEAARWSLEKLDPGPGYAAALAVKGLGWRLKSWQWV